MQDFYLILNWVVALALLALGAAALVKNHLLRLNRVFALFTFTIGVWIVSSYISNDTHNSPTESIAGNHFVFLFSSISGYLLVWFAVALAVDKRAEKTLRKLTPWYVIVAILTCTPLVVAGVEKQDSVYAVKFGVLIIAYAISLFGSIIAMFVILRRNIKIAKGDRKLHLRILYKSMAVALPFVLLAEFIIPAATGSFGLTNIGILPMAVPVVALYYSVVRLKLFDLRLVIARSLGYILALGLLASFYGVITFTAANLIFHIRVSTNAEVFISACTATASLVFPYLKKQFDRLTNRLFYRDAYDAQDVFDKLNKVLVSSLDVSFLMNQTVSILESALKPSYALIGLNAIAGQEHRIFASQRITMKHEDIEKLQQFVPLLRQKVIIADYLDDPKLAKLKDIMLANNVAVLVSFVQDAASSQSGLGYIALGNKRSGNPYTHQDASMLDAVANELIITIQNALHYEEIQNFNATLQEQVNDATHKLRRTNEKLKALDQTKDDFISMASHQLRTPLTSVKGYLSMVLEGDVGKINKQQREMLGQSFASSQRMVYLISDLLNISRLNTGKFIIDPAALNLADIVEQEMSQLNETAASKGIALSYDKPKNFPSLWLDETKTRQVIMNFMDNAIYYTQPGGHIAIRLSDTPDAVELRIVDDGIGVPKAEQHHLFTKFYRAGNARKARPDGTGLGLFMAKKVIAAQEGAVIFESTEGKGSTFGFRFSKAKHQVPAATPVPEPEKAKV